MDAPFTLRMARADDLSAMIDLSPPPFSTAVTRCTQMASFME